MIQVLRTFYYRIIANYLGDYVVKQETMRIPNEDIKHARANVPARLGSFPQDLDHYRTFKAADWKALLELFGTSLLYDYIPGRAHQNFIDLYDLWVAAITQHVTVSGLAEIRNKVTSYNLPLCYSVTLMLIGDHICEGI